MALNIISGANQIGQNAVNSQPNQNSEGAVKSGNNSGINSTNNSVNSHVSVNARDLGLSTGQTLSGQVVEVNGNEIKLLLNNNQTLNAKLEGNLNTVLGQTLSFEVSKTEGVKASLRPLYTNLSTSTAILDALKGAGLPNTEQNLRMVSTMMDEGMPVNKNALWDMSKGVYSFPDANPETIVKLTKLSLPITELTINQFENYENFEHQIKNDVMNLSKGIVDIMDEALKDANADIYLSTSNEALKDQTALTGKIPGIITNFLNAMSGNKETVAIQSASNLDAENNIVEGAANEASINNPETLLDEAGNPISESQLDENGNIISNEINNTPQFNSNGLKTALDVLNMLDLSNESLDKPVSNNLSKILNIIAENNDNNEKAIAEGANNTNDINEGNTAVLDGKNTSTETSTAGMTFKEALNITKNLLNNILNNGQDLSIEKKQMLSKFLTTQEFKENIKEGLSKQLFLKPEQFTGNEKIEDLYSKILKQANSALELMNNASKDNPELAKAAQNLSDNVNFMNELNQALTYVQIPLLMNNQSAHGDLYVYTNKKSLKEKDGNLTALLHLDMDNLGPMDVHIALNNGNKVKTNFILQDEATIDFIAAHIDILNDRLTKKGYDMSTSVTSKTKGEPETNIVDEFMKETPESKPVTKVKYSFDVRA